MKKNIKEHLLHIFTQFLVDQLHKLILIFNACECLCIRLELSVKYVVIIITLTVVTKIQRRLNHFRWFTDTVRVEFSYLKNFVFEVLKVYHCACSNTNY